jgi:hypothetical protein
VIPEGRDELRSDPSARSLQVKDLSRGTRHSSHWTTELSRGTQHSPYWRKSRRCGTMGRSRFAPLRILHPTLVPPALNDAAASRMMPAPVRGVDRPGPEGTATWSARPGRRFLVSRLPSRPVQRGTRAGSTPPPSLLGVDADRRRRVRRRERARCSTGTLHACKQAGSGIRVGELVRRASPVVLIRVDQPWIFLPSPAVRLLPAPFPGAHLSLRTNAGWRRMQMWASGDDPRPRMRAADVAGTDALDGVKAGLFSVPSRRLSLSGRSVFPFPAASIAVSKYRRHDVRGCHAEAAAAAAAAAVQWARSTFKATLGESQVRAGRVR